MAGVQVARRRVFDDGHALFDECGANRSEPAAPAGADDAVDERCRHPWCDTELEPLVVEHEDARPRALGVLFDELRDTGEDQFDLGAAGNELEDLALVALQRLGLPAFGDVVGDEDHAADLRIGEQAHALEVEPAPGARGVQHSEFACDRHAWHMGHELERSLRLLEFVGMAEIPEHPFVERTGIPSEDRGRARQDHLDAALCVAYGDDVGEILEQRGVVARRLVQIAEHGCLW